MKPCSPSALCTCMDISPMQDTSLDAHIKTLQMKHKAPDICTMKQGPTQWQMDPFPGKPPILTWFDRLL